MIPRTDSSSMCTVANSLRMLTLLTINVLEHFASRALPSAGLAIWGWKRSLRYSMSSNHLFRSADLIKDLCVNVISRNNGYSLEVLALCKTLGIEVRCSAFRSLISTSSKHKKIHVSLLPYAYTDWNSGRPIIMLTPHLEKAHSVCGCDFSHVAAAHELFHIIRAVHKGVKPCPQKYSKPEELKASRFAAEFCIPTPWFTQQLCYSSIETAREYLHLSLMSFVWRFIDILPRLEAHCLIFDGSSPVLFISHNHAPHQSIKHTLKTIDQQVQQFHRYLYEGLSCVRGSGCLYVGAEGGAPSLVGFLSRNDAIKYAESLVPLTLLNGERGCFGWTDDRLLFEYFAYEDSGCVGSMKKKLSVFFVVEDPNGQLMIQWQCGLRSLVMPSMLDPGRRCVALPAPPLLNNLRTLEVLLPLIDKELMFTFHGRSIDVRMKSGKSLFHADVNLLETHVESASNPSFPLRSRSR
jgi:hypothetical protein